MSRILSPPDSDGPSSLPDMGGPADDDYDVSHLDFAYVETCSDVRELNKLLAVLRFGKEGIYPELEAAIENRIVLLAPSSKVHRPAAPSLAASMEAAEEFKLWAQELKSKDNDLKQKKHMPATRPNIRSSSSSTTTTSHAAPSAEDSTKAPEQPTAKSAASQRIKSSDYRAWDRLDVDAELRRVDEEETMHDQKNAGARVQKPQQPDFRVPESVDDEEVAFLAEMEKNKGNEAYKAGEFEDAVLYYTRSLKLLERANVYTNRAIAYLKMKHYDKAEDDATAALSLNTPAFNFKAYFRRATARSKRGKYLSAIADLDAALKIGPDNRDAKTLRRECENKLKDVEGDKAAELLEGLREKKKRMVIEEVEEGEEEEGEGERPVEKDGEVPTAAEEGEERTDTPQWRKMPVVEIEDEDEDETEDVNQQPPPPPAQP
ncbi:Sperm associated antigen 1, partial [Borealophlyctis nickersoniae]